MKTEREIAEQWIAQQEAQARRRRYEHRYDLAESRRKDALDELYRKEKNEALRKTSMANWQMRAQKRCWMIAFGMQIGAMLDWLRTGVWWPVAAATAWMGVLRFLDMIRWFERKQDEEEGNRQYEIDMEWQKFHEWDRGRTP